ncbi:MAG: DUF4395 family protein, partial [Actinobacteria bacterium]|nr:DUF4395 family protein [Actinomycetota bacterium]
WWLLGLLAIQLAVGLTFGRRYCLPCVAYFELIQPRFGEGEIEDARPPRFANIVGAIFLTGATFAYAAGFTAIGTALGGMVSALALFAAATGLCVGCEIYKVIAKVRGVHPGSPQRIDLTELGAIPNGQVVVQFTHPLCTGCHAVERRLTAQGHDLVVVDVSKRPELARKYHVSVVPTAIAVGGDGRVLERLA